MTRAVHTPGDATIEVAAQPPGDASVAGALRRLGARQTLGAKLTLPILASTFLGALAQAALMLKGDDHAKILVLRPIAALMEATARLKDGSSARASPGCRVCRDEIAELARRFNSTAAAIGELHQRLAQTATTDEPTGLYNRHHLMEALDREIARSRRCGEPLALVVTDLDDLKRVNDGLGHGAGDAALRGVANALRSALRESDLAARIGGDEFVAVLPGCSTADLLSVLDRLRAASRSAVQIAADDPDAARTTLSAGATVLKSGDSAASLLRRADRALCQAKRGGKNQSRIAA